MNLNKVKDFLIINVDKNIETKSKKKISINYFQSFLSCYYFKLFTKINDELFNEEFHKVYDSNKYLDFFYENFIDNQNVLIFTTYNQLPIEFLPFPNKKYYFSFPLITFYGEKIYSEGKIQLEKNLISDNIVHREHIFDIYMNSNDDYPNQNVMKKVQNSLKNKKMIDDDINTLNIPIRFIKILSNQYFNDKILYLFVNKKIIICDKFKKDKNKIILIRFYQKVNKNSYKSLKNLIINIDDIKYLSIYKKFNHEDLLNVFPTVILKKDALLYNEKNIHEYVPSKNTGGIPRFFTLYPKFEIQEPLYMPDINNYYCTQYKLKESVELLDLTTNIFYLFDETKKTYTYTNYRESKTENKLTDDIFRCIGDSKFTTKINECDIDIITKFEGKTYPNYNRRTPLSLIIWKNVYYSDRNMKILSFFNSLKFNGYFNNFAYAWYKNNIIKLLGNEIVFSNKIIAEKYVKKNKDKVIDLCKNIYANQYKNL